MSDIPSPTATGFGQLQWDESFSTGVPEIDAQHRELIRQVNALTLAILDGQGREKIVSTLEFLMRYSVEHFKDEEACMDHYRCPAAAANREAHRHFTDKMVQKLERIQSEGVNHGTVLEVLGLMHGWLSAHILGTDTKLRPCIGKSHAAPVLPSTSRATPAAAAAPPAPTPLYTSAPPMTGTDR